MLHAHPAIDERHCHRPLIPVDVRLITSWDSALHRSLVITNATYLRRLPLQTFGTAALTHLQACLRCIPYITASESATRHSSLHSYSHLLPAFKHFRGLIVIGIRFSCATARRTPACSLYRKVNTLAYICYTWRQWIYVVIRRNKHSALIGKRFMLLLLSVNRWTRACCTASKCRDSIRPIGLSELEEYSSMTRLKFKNRETWINI